MNCDIVLDSITSIRYVEEGKYSSIKASLVVKVSFDVVREINLLTKECWEDLSTQFALYRQSRAYYVKYGGVCPSMQYQLDYRNKIEKLREIKNFILDYVNEIKSKGYWEYDIGYCKYLRMLKEVLGI